MTSPQIPLGVPYKDAFSLHNSRIVLDAVAKRFPDWVARCEPYVNVLTLPAWNRRGYRVKKGEHAIRVFTKAPVYERDEKTGDRKIVGSRPATAFVFALPQVEKRDPSGESGGTSTPPAAKSGDASDGSSGTPATPSRSGFTSDTSGTTSASTMP